MATYAAFRGAGNSLTINTLSNGAALFDDLEFFRTGQGRGNLT
jgi:hypothetical protein